MRRRIYIDPEGPLDDITSEPYQWDVDAEPWQRADWCKVGVLEDESLWQAYREAEEAAQKWRARVCRALRYSPYSDAERALHERAKSALDDVDGNSSEVLDEMTAIRLEALRLAGDPEVQ